MSENNHLRHAKPTLDIHHLVATHAVSGAAETPCKERLGKVCEQTTESPSGLPTEERLLDNLSELLLFRNTRESGLRKEIETWKQAAIGLTQVSLTTAFQAQA